MTSKTLGASHHDPMLIWTGTMGEPSGQGEQAPRRDPMLTWTARGVLATIVGLLATLVGLAFGSYMNYEQLSLNRAQVAMLQKQIDDGNKQSEDKDKQFNRMLGITLWSQSTQQFHAVMALLVRYPEAIPYFESGKVLADDAKERDRVLILADMQLDAMDLVIYHADTLPGILPGVEGWRSYVKNCFKNSPVLRDRLKDKESDYVDNPGFHRLAEEGAKLAEAINFANPSVPNPLRVKRSSASPSVPAK